MGQLLNLHDFRRSLIDGGELLKVILHEPEDAVSDVVPRFGKERCVGSPSGGRWVNFAGRECEAPYCTGKIEDVLGRDWVSDGCGRCCVCCGLVLRGCETGR
jgi:hypothetical protein